MFYAVRKGRSPGIYENWSDAKEQVDGFPGAVFKKFKTYEEAEDYVFPNIIKEVEEEKEEGLCLSAYTDGSFLDNVAGWGYVLIKNGLPFYNGFGKIEDHFGMRNIASEIEAAVRAIKKAVEMGAVRIDIYHDYEGVGRWPDGDWKANREKTSEYSCFVNEMRKKLKIYFHKVKGHSSTEMNDMADSLAAKGTSADKPFEGYIGESYDVNADFEEPEKAPVNLAELLKKWREKNGLSISAAAKKTGVSSYGKLEAGEDIKLSAETMKELYNACGGNCTLSEFLMLWIGR